MEKIQVFISYSWDSEDHREWVQKFATDLDCYAELDVLCDIFDLDELSDKNFYMEKMMKSNFVFVVATKKYKAKADSRDGGVGIETYLTTARHWDELSKNNGKSSIIMLKREEDSVPEYLKGKIFIDFSDDRAYQKSFGRVIDILKGVHKKSRPEKTLSFSKGTMSNFTRCEQILKINHKNRRAIIDSSEGTDFSGGNKIKFEIWETKSPNVSYFLMLFENVNIRKTIERAAYLLKEKSISPKQITVLRSNQGEKGLIERSFKEHGLTIEITEITYSEYVWDYCIDSELKTSVAPDTIENYTDQSLSFPDKMGDLIIKESAKTFLGQILQEKESPTAHIIVAPGGMGKTSLCAEVFKLLIKKSSQDKIVVLIQAESLRRYLSDEGLANIHINSIYDLYEIYKKSHSDQNIFDLMGFELAVLCGKLIVIIDGLDELISLFHDRIDLSKFLKSIQALHDELGCSQLLITTRSSATVEQNNLARMGMIRYDLLGFNTQNCTEYAKSRFKLSSKKEELTKKFKRKIEEIKSQTSDERVIPFFADIVASILIDTYDTSSSSAVSIIGYDKVESNASEDDLEINDEEIPYRTNSDITDRIIFAVFRREEIRHKLNKSISDLVSIISELVVIHGESIPRSKLEEHLELLYGEEQKASLIEKISLNPLLAVRGKYLQLRYAFLESYFKTIYILDSLSHNSIDKNFIACLSKLSPEKDQEAKDIIKFYRKQDRNHSFLDEIKKIIESLKKDMSSQVKTSEVIKRAVSSLIWLSREIKQMSPLELKKLLIDLFLYQMSNKSIPILQFVFMYGNHPAMDFSDLIIQESKFYDYPMFSKSKFNTKTQFMECRFDKCATQSSPDKSITEATFDRTCDLGDLKQVIQEAKLVKGEENVFVESDVNKFLHCFYDAGRFVDVKKTYMKFSSKVPGLLQDRFERLIKNGYIQIKIEKQDEIYYEITQNFKESTRRFLADNYKTAQMKEFIKYVKQA